VKCDGPTPGLARPPMFKTEEKQRIVLSVLRGECSVAEAARRSKCSETSIAKWRDQFVQAGLAALEVARKRPVGARGAA
jgi:transposase